MRSMKFFPIPNRYQLADDDNGRTYKGFLRLNTYINLFEVGKVYELFIEIFDYYNSPERPLMCISIIKNGSLKIDGELPIYNDDIAHKKIHIRSTPTYLEQCYDNKEFHVDRLIYDDFLEAIEMLLATQHYIEALKLIISSIDSFAFLELGDVNKNFNTWINTYFDLDALRVSAEELWELRNSILHMTNFESRNVIGGKVSRLILQISTISNLRPNKTFDGKYLNIHQFYAETTIAVEKWLASITSNTGKLRSFIDRYDSIVSNSRYTTIQLK